MNIAEIHPGVLERLQHAPSGGLIVWGVLYEDLYETQFGDGFYLSLRGVALSEADALRLAALAGQSEMTRWRARAYRIVLQNGLVQLDGALKREEEFSLDDVLRQLSEIEPGQSTSKLLIGSGAAGRQPGADLLSLDRR